VRPPAGGAYAFLPDLRFAAAVERLLEEERSRAAARGGDALQDAEAAVRVFKARESIYRHLAGGGRGAPPADAIRWIRGGGEASEEESYSAALEAARILEASGEPLFAEGLRSLARSLGEAISQRGRTPPAADVRPPDSAELPFRLELLRPATRGGRER
jgi:hypothetical protein